MELSGSLVIIHVRCSGKVLESIRLVIHLKNNLAYIVRLPDSVFVPFFIAFIIIFFRQYCVVCVMELIGRAKGVEELKL